MATYVALGDSASIDDYTGVVGGGAPAQLARKLNLELVDLARDGNTTEGVCADLARIPPAVELVTLTAGGNDLLLDESPNAIMRRLERTAGHLDRIGARVIINTVYDPSDGDDALGARELGLPLIAVGELRRRLDATNAGIRELAARHGFLLADLEQVFRGHGVASRDPWFVQVIEPNLRGATAIANRWHELLQEPLRE